MNPTRAKDGTLRGLLDWKHVAAVVVWCRNVAEIERSPTRTLQLTRPSIAALLRGLADERQSLCGQSEAATSRRSTGA
jgi:hypothetical protein